MIISASRRTDIPSHYSDWFYNRMKEGFVLVRNPMNFHQISKISLAADVVDSIVFWTKNPIPMFDRLSELSDYMYYFQFTITPYDRDVEPNLPTKKHIITAFKRLSDSVGADRVIWRYDPILISEKYSREYHIHAFGKVAEELYDYTRKVTISFIDVDYRGVNRKELVLRDIAPATQMELASQLAEIAHHYGLIIDACAEETDLQKFGIDRARCIDDRLLGKLLGCGMNLIKDKNQRLTCGCVTSIDIGMYNTCLNGCRYCYANYNRHDVERNFAGHNPHSSLISGEVGEKDNIKEREAKSCCDAQMRLFGE